MTEQEIYEKMKLLYENTIKEVDKWKAIKCKEMAPVLWDRYFHAQEELLAKLEVEQ